jgi:penicillin V acylase-like amidase (Ntn superfamily)
MTNRLAPFGAGIFLCLLVAEVAFPCTTFVQEGGSRVYLCKNLDWDWENGMVFVNPRNIDKTAIVAEIQHAARWTSKYGSVTFNQLGREMPFGGMNEAGHIQANTSSGALKFQDWTQAGQREYAERFFSQGSFKQDAGDITGMIEPALPVLRGCTVDQ